MGQAEWNGERSVVLEMADAEWVAEKAGVLELEDGVTLNDVDDAALPPPGGCHRRCYSISATCLKNRLCMQEHTL